MTSPLIELCTPRQLAAVTNARAYDRGERYADEGRVQVERLDDHAAVATSMALSATG